MLPLMKRSCTVLLILGIVAVANSAEPGFWAQLTPEERKTGGVDQLTPEQQAALDRLAERFAHRETEPLREQARREARAEARQQVEAEQKVRAVAAAGRSDSETSAIVHARIVGAFEGWSGQTLFRLDNGQVWKQSNASDSQWFPSQQDLEVEIRRNTSGWKLRLLPRGWEVYVRRVK